MIARISDNFIKHDKIVTLILIALSQCQSGTLFSPIIQRVRVSIYICQATGLYKWGNNHICIN